MTANCTGQAAGWRTPRSGLLSSSIRMRRPPAHSTATYTFSWMRNWTRSAAYNATAAAAVQAALGHHLWTDWVWKDTICSAWAPAPRPRLLPRCIRSCLHPVSHLEEDSHLPRASVALARAPRSWADQMGGFVPLQRPLFVCRCARWERRRTVWASHFNSHPLSRVQACQASVDDRPTSSSYHMLVCTANSKWMLYLLALCARSWSRLRSL